ncbi:FAD-dependent monooxygenase [Pseudonocardiaceae bacterium YIM PH 21723]|nr:FAD-dependent monooxygenase [Pseudonocardiaceae bacterium YIM PH 21723]
MRALVIGGGAAGTIAAMALVKAGIQATIFEAHSTGADDRGAYLSVQPNGMDALRAIDAHRVVEEVSYPSHRVEVFDDAGRQVGEMRREGSGASRVLTRAGLCRALQAEAARRGIGVEHGRRLVDATVSADGVTARFADGGQAQGDLLVGADGVWSRVRSLIDPAAPRPRYTGQNIVYGYARTVSTPTPPDTVRMYQGRRAYFGYRTVRDRTTWWFARLPTAEVPMGELAGMDWRSRAIEFVAEDRTPAAEVIRASDIQVLGVNAYSIDSLPAWHNDRMVLVGDAVHAASPAAAQGSAMTFEDAVVLGKCLRDLPVPAAFGAYERLRRERVESSVAASAAMGDRSSEAKDYRWLYEHHIAWDQPISP